MNRFALDNLKKTLGSKIINTSVFPRSDDTLGSYINTPLLQISSGSYRMYVISHLLVPDLGQRRQGWACPVYRGLWPMSSLEGEFRWCWTPQRSARLISRLALCCFKEKETVRTEKSSCKGSYKVMKVCGFKEILANTAETPDASLF